MVKRIQVLVISALTPCIGINGLNIKACIINGRIKELSFDKSIIGNIRLNDEAYYPFKVKETETLMLLAQILNDTTVTVKLWFNGNKDKTEAIELSSENKSNQLYVQSPQYYIVKVAKNKPLNVKKESYSKKATEVKDEITFKRNGNVETIEQIVYGLTAHCFITEK